MNKELRRTTIQRPGVIVLLWGLVGLVLVAASLAGAVSPAAAVEISGLVTDAVTGAPIAGVVVSDNSSLHSETDASGRYLLDATPGTYQLTVERAGYVAQTFVWDASTSVSDVAGSAMSDNRPDIRLDQNGQVSGTVADGRSGEPVPGVIVELFGVDSANPNPDASTSTGVDGSYTLSLPQGSYRVLFEAADTGLRSEWLGGADQRSASATVQVSTGGSVVGVDAELSQGDEENVFIAGAQISARTTAQLSAAAVTSLSGRVLLDGVTPQAGIEVAVLDPVGKNIATGTTDGNGNFSIGGLQPNWYTVSAKTAAGEAYFIGGAQELWAAEFIEATAAYSPTGVTVDLWTPGSLTGLVVNELGQPVEGAWIEASNGERTFTARSDVEGRYSLPVSPGVYVVEASFMVWIDGTGRSARASSPPLPVAHGQLVQAPPISFDSRGGRIGGTVLDSSGNPVADARVLAYDNDEDRGDETFTDAHGHYSLYVAAGGYQVAVEQDAAPSTWFPDAPTRAAAQQLSVTGGASLTADFLLHSDRSIAGVVTRPVGSPDTGVFVSLLTRDGLMLATSYADEGGAYSISNVRPGSYILQVWATGLVPVSQDLTVGEEDLRLTRDFELAEGASVAGSSEAEQVVAVDASTGILAGWSYVDVDGHYAISGLPAGDYVIAGISDESDGAVWYSGTSFSDARRLTLAADTHLTGIDLIGSSGPQIAEYTLSGQVHLPDGSPATPADYAAVQLSFYGSDNGGYQVNPDESGHYEVTVAAGSYEVSVEALGAVYPSATVTVAANTIYDFDLVSAGTLRGSVSSPTGGGWGSDAFLLDADGVTDRASISEDGRYSFENLPAGDFTVCVRGKGSGYVRAYEACLGGSPTATGATYLHVGPGEVLTAPDIAIGMGGSITGKLDSFSGEVQVMDETGEAVLAKYQGWYASGYAIRGLRPGKVFVRFINTGGGVQWWPDSDAFSEAQPLMIRAGDVIRGVDSSFSRQERGSISGRVTLNGAGFSGVRLSLDNAVNGSMAYDDSFPKGDGTYTLRGLEPGRYVLYAHRCYGSWYFVDGDWNSYGCSGTPQGGYYPAFADRELAGVITVGEGQEVEGINFAFTTGAATVTSSGNPLVRGQAQYGSVLQADPGEWSPAPVDLAYQWYRDSAPISGAETASYPVDVDDIGHTLKVSLTGSRSGYSSATRISQPTPVVRASEFTSAPDPRITNTAPRVGDALELTSGEWLPAAASFTYQWLRDGSPVAGASSARYTVQEADLDAALSVTITGARAGYAPVSRTSEPSQPVQAEVQLALTATPTPLVSDTTPVVGQAVNAGEGPWAPAGVAFAYQWFQGSTPIDGATAISYRVQGADLGKTLKVRVTGSKPGYQSVSKTSTATAAVTAGALSPTPVPTVDDITPTVDQTVSAVPGGWNPAPMGFKFQWYKVSSGGTTYTLTGATAGSYLARPSDVGYRLKVTVTGSKTGYKSVSKTSATTGYVTKAQFSIKPTPAIGVDGTVRVGKPLTALPGTYEPVATKYAFKWYRGTTAIVGATKATYTPTSSDLGKQVKVRVRAYRSGYATLTQYGDPTSAIAAGLAGLVVPKLSDSTPVVDQTIAVANQVCPALAGNGNPVTPVYQWSKGATPIGDALEASYEVRPGDAGGTIKVTVACTAADYAPTAKTSAASTTITKAIFTAKGVATINGPGLVGQELGAENGTWIPVPDSFSYQWYRNGTALSGKTARAYTPTSTGSYTVKVTAHKAGYTTASSTSAGRAVTVT